MLAELVDKPGIGMAVAGWVDGLVVPLEQPLRIGQCAILFGVGGCRDEEHLGLDLGRLRALGIALPEDRAFGLEPVEDDQPVKAPQPGAVEAGIGPAATGILAEQEVALELA